MARGIYHGLTIELKAEKGRASKEQLEWAKSLQNEGYKALIMPKGLDHWAGLKWLKLAVVEYLMKQS